MLVGVEETTGTGVVTRGREGREGGGIAGVAALFVASRSGVRSPIGEITEVGEKGSIERDTRQVAALGGKVRGVKSG